MSKTATTNEARAKEGELTYLSLRPALFIYVDHITIHYISVPHSMGFFSFVSIFMIHIILLIASVCRTIVPIQLTDILCHR